MSQSKQWLNKAAIAAHLGIGPRTVDAWMRRGLIPFVKAGTHKQSSVRFNAEAVDKALGRFTYAAKEVAQ